MTAQAPDRIVLDGEESPLFSNPLEDYFETTGEKSPFFSSWTNLWRGYVASWSIENGILCLTEVNGGDPQGERILIFEWGKQHLQEIVVVPPGFSTLARNAPL